MVLGLLLESLSLLHHHKSIPIECTLWGVARIFLGFQRCLELPNCCILHFKVEEREGWKDEESVLFFFLF